MESSLPANETAVRPSHRYRAFAIRIGLGVAIIGFLLWRFNAGPALRSLARERMVYFAVTVALYLIAQSLSGWRWQTLAAVLNLHAPVSECVRYYFICMFTNVFVPGLIGGDAARAFYLGRKYGKTAEAIASVVADRGYGLLALFGFAAAIALTLNHGTLSTNVTNPVVAIGILAVVGYLASPWIARLIHLTPRPIRRMLGIVAPYLHRPATVAPAIVLSLILQAILATCQFVLALGMGLHLPLALFLLIVPIAGVLAALPLTLNGLGLRETAYLYLFGMAGVSREDAIALGLLYFAATMVGGLVGGIAFVTTEVPTPRTDMDTTLTNVD